jgi:spermidine synthase
MCIQLGNTLYEGESEYQKIAIYETPHYGRMMTIDGCIQSTERDEFAYHEMMAHVPLFSHPAPNDVCIIGGGDGGVLREVLRHDTIKSGNFRIDPRLSRQSRFARSRGE